jgi:hypothetical protein
MKVAEATGGALVGKPVDWTMAAEGIAEIVLAKLQLADKVKDAVVGKLKKLMDTPTGKALREKVTKIVVKNAQKVSDKSKEVIERACQKITETLIDKAGEWSGEKVEELIKDEVKAVATKATGSNMTYGELAQDAQAPGEQKLLDTLLGAETGDEAIKQAAQDAVKDLIDQKNAAKN